MISYQCLHYLLIQPIFTAKNSMQFGILTSDQSKYLCRLIQQVGIPGWYVRLAKIEPSTRIRAV